MTRPHRAARLVAAAIALTLVATACTPTAEDEGTLPETTEVPLVEVVAEGLVNPLGLAMLPDGGLLISEEGTGEDDASAGVSVLTTDGRVGRVVSGLPSGRDAGDLSGAPLVGVSPDGTTAYVAHFGSEALLTFPIPTSGLEPATKAVPALRPADLDRTMTPLNNVALVNAFDIAFDETGRPVVTDASSNGIATENDDGATVFTHRLGELSDPSQPSLKIDAVPTGITRVGEEFYVTFTGGCPYPAGSGVVAAVGTGRSQRLIATDLNMPIDVERGPSGTIWLLEFASFDRESSCFTGDGYRPASGRLSAVNEDGEITEVMTGLDFPGSVVEAPNGDLFITEIFSGRILRIRWSEDADSEPTVAPAQPTLWQLHDVADQVGLDFEHGAFAAGLSEDPAAMMGAGLCWIDFDRDGWLDLYLVNSHAEAEAEYWADQGGLPTNELYRNVDGSFVRAGAEAGVDIAHRGNGCVAADFDGDGYTDLFVTADGPNVLFHNRGDNTFVDVAAQAGVADDEWNTAAVVGDLNGDGLPDLFVGSYIDLGLKIDKPSGAFPQDYLGIPNHLYLNMTTNGPIRFEERTSEAGLKSGNDAERTLGALLSDFDRDGDLDLYVANDGQPNRLFRNDTQSREDISLVDVTGSAGVGDPGSGMGVAGGDYDGNGTIDLIVTNWEAELNALYANDTSGSDMEFGYMTQRIGLAGLGNNKTGWGVSWVDLDNDTDLDMLIAHGRVPVTDVATDPELVRVYGNLLAEGQPGQFRDWTRVAGLDLVGPLLARGSAAADFDNDGDMDVAINSIGGSVALLRNESPPGHWLMIEFVGYHPGVTVTVELANGQELRREWYSGSSYLASEDPRLHFGLGDNPAPVEITVEWPDGTAQIIEGVATDQRLLVIKPTAE